MSQYFGTVLYRSCTDITKTVHTQKSTGWWTDKHKLERCLDKGIHLATDHLRVRNGFSTAVKYSRFPLATALKFLRLLNKPKSFRNSCRYLLKLFEILEFLLQSKYQYFDFSPSLYM